MVNNVKRFIDRKYSIKYEKLNDRACIAEVNSLLEEAFKNAMESLHFEFNHSTDFTEKLNEVLDSNGEIYVVRRGKSIIGTLSVKFEDVNAWYYSGRAVGVYHVAVSPKYQGTGLGKGLLDMAKTFAKEQNLPLRLTTPEKNASAIGFYEKNGFSKVKMYLAGDHYAVYLMNWGSLTHQFTQKQIKMNYEGTALNSLMKNFRVCGNQSDEKIQKRWQNEFLKYMEGCDDEQLLDMRKCFKRYGITPREYSLYGFDGKGGQSRSKYLSKHTVAQLNEASKTKQSTGLPSSKDVVSGCVQGEYASNTKAYIRVLTVNDKEKIHTAYACINFVEQGKNERFAGINVDSGTVETPIYRIASGKRKKSVLELEKSEIEDWNGIKAQAARLGEKRGEVLLGIDFARINNQWTAVNVATKPSLINFQLISKGIRDTVEEITRQEIDVKLAL